MNIENDDELRYTHCTTIIGMIQRISSSFDTSWREDAKFSRKRLLVNGISKPTSHRRLQFSDHQTRSFHSFLPVATHDFGQNDYATSCYSWS